MYGSDESEGLEGLFCGRKMKGSDKRIEDR